MTLIFKIHYFLWYGGLTSIFNYEMVYSHQYTNSTTIQYGYLNMILPFITVITTPFICSMADRHRKHRSYFTISLMCTMFALCLYAMLPLIMDTPPPFDRAKNTTTDAAAGDNDDNPDNEKGLYTGAWIYFCFTALLCHLSMGINNCLSDSFAVLQADELKISFGRIIVWGTFGWASSALALCGINQLTFLPRLLPGILFGATLLTIDIVIVSFWKKNSDFKLDLIPPSAAQTLTGSASHSAYKDPADYMPLNESAKINMGTGVNNKDGSRHRLTESPLQILKSSFISGEKRMNPMPLIGNNNNYQIKPIKQITTIPATILGKNPKEEEGTSENASSSIKTIDSDFEGNESTDDVGLSDQSDSSGYSRLDKLIGNRNKTIGTNDSLKALAESKTEVKSLIDQQQELNTKKNAETIPNNENEEVKKGPDKNFATSFRMQLILLGIILKKRRSFIRYLILFILAGFFMSMHWNYFFLYLEQIFRSKFAFISALSMVNQSLLGELPFFILSRKFIDFFGRSHTLSISIISIGVRFILYGFLLPNVNMYLIILCDCFQGPNYGLFYVIMTEVGLEYSFCDDETINLLANRNEIDRNNNLQVNTIRLSLRSTIQSVAFACYEGLGVGLGSVVGGWLVHTYGFHILWLTMAIGSISVGTLNIILELLWTDEVDENEQDNNNVNHVKASGSQSDSNEAKREFEEASRKGTLQKVSGPKSFPSPIPMSPFKFQQSPAIKKLQMLAVQKATEATSSSLAPPER